MLNKLFFKLFTIFILTLVSNIAASQSYSLVKDINVGANQGITSPNSIIMNNVLYFIGFDSQNGAELWRTDGTASGTYLLKDINQGVNNSEIQYFTVAGNKVFFVANNGKNGKEIWVSDGTTTGTTMVVDLIAGSASNDMYTFPGQNRTFKAYKNKVYFRRPDGIWESDGTTAGTKLFYADQLASDLAVYDNALYFISEEAKLYKSDGTKAGTNLLIKDGTSGYSVIFGKMAFVESPLGIVFTGRNSLWITKGTLATTAKLYESTASFVDELLHRNAFVGNKFYFCFDDNNSEGYQVWVTDGTAAGTKRVKKIGNNYVSAYAAHFVATNDYCYFIYSDGVNNRQLWRTDGTEVNTIKLTTFSDDSDLEYEWNGSKLIASNNKIKFLGQYQDGLYVNTSDGTLAGTTKDFKVADNNVFGITSPIGVNEVNNFILFSAKDNTYGTELFRVGLAPLDVSVKTVDKLKCFGDKNASIEASVQGTTAKITYKWSNGESSAKISSLAAGTYTVTITTDDNKTAIQSYTLNQPDKINVTVTTNSSPDGFNIGKVKAEVIGGTSPYSYAWNTNPIQTSIEAKGLNSGKYTVTITDTNTCTSIADITVSKLIVNIITTGTNKCFGDKSTDAEIKIPEWNTPNTYLWSSGETMAKTNKLGAGNYNVTVTNSLGEKFWTSVTITQPLQISITTTSTPTSATGTTGTATVSTTGGTAPYKYIWNTTPAQISATALNLGEGTYQVTVTDNNSCAKVESSIVYKTLSVNITQTNVIKCNGDKTLKLDAVVSGGKIPYNYLWNNNTTQISNTVGAGVHSVTITDGLGKSTISAITITEPTKISLASKSKAANPIHKNGNAEVTTTGGTPPYKYSWNTNPVQTTAIAINLVPGTYTVTVTDANTCKASINVTVGTSTNSNDITKAMGLKIYPNPAQDYLTIETNDANMLNFATYKITDIGGKVVMNGNLSSNKIEVNQLVEGTYILMLGINNTEFAKQSFQIIK